MNRRLKRILLRALIVLTVLFAIGLAAFTWFAFWPFEGSVGDPARLVPGQVDFVYKTTWKELKASGWIQDNVQADPFVPQVSGAVDALRQVLEQVTEMEDQINSQIPLGIAKFSVEDDVFGGELLAAGRFCEGSGPEHGPPTWRELLVLTRITWKPKFFAALKHGFVRSRLGPMVSVDDVGDGIYRFTLNNVRPTPLRARRGCGPDVTRPPENIWFGMRVKDVLVFGNAEHMLRDVAWLAENPDSGRSFVERPWITLDAPEGAIAGSVDVKPLYYYLTRAVQRAGAPITILQRYLTIRSLDRMNGHLRFPSPDQLQAHASMRYHEADLRLGVRDVYDLAPTDVTTGLVSLLPAEDTFGVLLLRTPPLHLIQGIYSDILSQGARDLWQGNLRRLGGYTDIDQFFAQFAEKLGDTAAVAVGRMSERFDRTEFPRYYNDPKEYPDPNWPALVMMVPLKTGTTPQELDAFLADRVPLLGASRELEQAEHMGMPYTRVKLEVQFGDYALVQPAWLLTQKDFVFCSNEDYLKKIIETLARPQDHPPLSADLTFRATMRQLPEKAHVALFLDLEKLFRVPPTSVVGAQPRGFFWDQRNIWVVKNRSVRQAAIAFRAKLKAEHIRRTGRPPTQQQQAEIERRVDAYGDRLESHEGYLEAEGEYRDLLAGYRRLLAFGLTIREHSDPAQGTWLDLDLTGLLRSGSDEP